MAFERRPSAFEPTYKMAGKLNTNVFKFSDKTDVGSPCTSLRSSSEDGLKLVDEVIGSMIAAKTFQENAKPVNSIDYSASGETLVSSAEDDKILLYNCETGKISRITNSRKYGVDHIQWTHHPTCVIHASTKVNDAVRYLSLWDNKYIRNFEGHTDQVTGLSLSAVDDRFMSTSLDYTLRMWDLRSPQCVGLMGLSGHSIAAMDQQGQVFAVLMNGDCINLYDFRRMSNGPFSTFLLPSEPATTSKSMWASLKFSNNGKFILLNEHGSGEIKILDALKGNPIAALRSDSISKDKKLVLEASFTPDSKYVISGSENGKVHVWDIANRSEICRLGGAHAGPIQCIKFNPIYMMMASASGKDTAFWLPNTLD